MARINLAVDFGSSTTHIYSIGNGIVLSEPTVLAVSSDKYSEIRALGIDAKRLVGKTAENTKVVFPVFHGEVASENFSRELLDHFMQKIEIGYSDIVKAVFAVPTGIDSDSLKKYRKLAHAVGIKEVSFVEVPILSAVGQQIPLTDFTPYFIIDMGGGVTNIAAVSLDGIITGLSVNLGGCDIDAKLIDYIAEKYNLQIGLLTAEKIKNTIGSLLKKDISRMLVNGRDIEKGRPRSLSLSAQDVIEPIKMYFDKVAEFASSVFAKLPPEVSAEIRHSGLYISGGLAQMPGLEEYYEAKFGMKINVAEEPETATVLGGGMVLGNNELLTRLRVNID